MIELGHETDRKPPFRYAAYTRVAFSDTDAQGVVYYGRYMPYFDLARVEYHAPARFDDLLEVFVRVERIGTTSVTYDHAAYLVDDDVLMATAKQTLVHIDAAARRPLPVPDAFRAQVGAFEDA